METSTKHTYDLAYAVDVAKCAQVTTDYQQLARKLAGPLEDIIARVFPGHLLMVYLVTDISRRQIWNAYLSSPRVFPQLEWLTEEQATELRVSLLTCRSYALIVDGYGSSERGLIGLYGKLGPEAQPSDFYPLFHQTLTANEPLRRSLCHVPSIQTMALSLICTLPPELQSYPFAKELVNYGLSDQFLELYGYIQQQNFSNKDALMDRLYRLIRVGRGYRAALKDILHALDFPPQVVLDEGQLRFIRNGVELAKTADRYRNCLRSEVSTAFSGECQFYEWDCSTPAIVCLKRHRGNTWYISAINLSDNAEPSEVLENEIRSHFARYGIGERRCVADLFGRLIGLPAETADELAELEAMRGG